MEKRRMKTMAMTTDQVGAGGGRDQQAFRRR